MQRVRRKERTSRQVVAKKKPSHRNKKLRRNYEGAKNTPPYQKSGERIVLRSFCHRNEGGNRARTVKIVVRKEKGKNQSKKAKKGSSGRKNLRSKDPVKASTRKRNA